MLQRQTLTRKDDESGGPDEFEEPDGEIIETLDTTARSITVLTRVDDPPKYPFEPSEFTVAELSDKVAGADYSREQLQALISREQQQKNRTTALNKIREEMD